MIQRGGPPTDATDAEVPGIDSPAAMNPAVTAAAAITAIPADVTPRATPAGRRDSSVPNHIRRWVDTTMTVHYFNRLTIDASVRADSTTSSPPWPTTTRRDRNTVRRRRLPSPSRPIRRRVRDSCAYGPVTTWGRSIQLVAVARDEERMMCRAVRALDTLGLALTADRAGLQRLPVVEGLQSADL